MPGGYGTMEELLEITTWSQLNIHAKPVVLFNMKGYYTHLIDFIQHSVNGMYPSACSLNDLIHFFVPLITHPLLFVSLTP
jgi:uncharacterized protein (TIGR00730 family)